ncbi:DUF2431 domain-containing protein [Candidatus Woesearchaeota archaeon]|nr:DUF2431 domain-containing protein [Candidatus Woesearchaeota archaeon]
MYEPQEDSYLLLKHVKELAFGKVIDVGTGSGIQAEGAAMSPNVNQVYAVDIDEKAISELKKKEFCQGENCKVTPLHSDLFANVSGKFDTIIFNPPYLPFEDDDKDTSLDGGEQGHELIEEFLNQAKKHLTPGGLILMVFSSRTGKEEVDKAIKKQGYKHELLEQKSLAFFEELYAYRITIA